MYPCRPAHRSRTAGVAALIAALALALAAPLASQAAENNPNQYSCLGHQKAGQPEPGNEEQPVSYSFYCDGPITGYQVQSQIPVTGIAGSPLVTSNATGLPLTDTFSCSGELPGYALNCVGLAQKPYETITGQFSIGTKLCAEPRVDSLLTVTYAYLEKGAIVQAISGPYELGRPLGCRLDQFSGMNRLNPKRPSPPHKHSGKTKAKKSRRSHLTRRR